ncbi:uncharacterized protein [Procambarus clarkii]|uniref:uncharacterized protein n=1 Tax=Procambarus clarkii TaxID=6728 RepID=UPI003742BB73
MIPRHRVCVSLCVAGLVVATCSPAPQAQRSREANSSGGRQEQCPLGSEVEVGGEATSGDSSGRRVVVMVPVVGGLGASAARTSCRSRSTTPLFLNTQHDADVLHRLLKGG